jgi:hypothetical protein
MLVMSHLRSTSVVLFLSVLELKLRAYTLSHSTGPTFFVCWIFSRKGLMNYLPRLALNRVPLDLCLLSREDYRREPLVPGFLVLFYSEKKMKDIISLIIKYPRTNA